MSKKSYALSMTPPSTQKAEQWVAKDNGPSAGPTKRLTIELAIDVHSKIKAHCALRGLKMAAVFRDIIEREFCDTKTQM